MSALSRTPQNTNYLQPSKFILSFNKIPDTQYFCQAINLPGLKLGMTTIETPFRTLPVAGTKMDYDTLDIRFNVNGDISSWMNLHDWMRSIGSPDGFSTRTNTGAPDGLKGDLSSYSDATLVILSNLNNPIARFHFYNLVPVSLSSIDFDTTLSADDIVVGSASFQFDYYDHIPQ